MKMSKPGIRTLLAVLAIAFGTLAPAQTPQNIVVTSAASFQVGLPPAGSLGTIFCTGLQVQGTISAETIPLPRTLAGVSVTVGGAPAPLLAVASQGAYQMVNFQVPQEAVIGIDNTAAVIVAQNGNQGSTQAALSTSPGDFFTSSGGYGVFVHSLDFSPVTKDKPAQSGEILVGYLTGLPGNTQPVIPTGESAPVFPVAMVRQHDDPFGTDTYSISVGGVELANNQPVIEVPFIGLTPGLEGVYQIDFTVPPGLPSGDATVFLTHADCMAPDLADGCPNPETRVTHGASVLLPVR